MRSYLGFRLGECSYDPEPLYLWVQTYRGKSPCFIKKGKDPTKAKFTVEQVKTIYQRMQYYKDFWRHLMLPGEKIGHFQHAVRSALLCKKNFDEFNRRRRVKRHWE